MDKWIDVNERLPECYLTHDIFKRPDKFITDSVLVTVESREFGGIRYYVSTDLMIGNSKEDIHWLMSCGYGGSAVYSQKIIAWMPLPKPYEIREETTSGI